MKGKSVIRLLALSLCAILALSACTAAPAPTQPPSSEPAAPVETPEPTPEPPFQIKALWPFYAQEPPKLEGNPALEAMEKATNVKLDVTWVPQGDFVQVFTTTMASSDIPQFIAVTSGTTSNANFIKYSQAGAFWDLTDSIQASPLFRDKLTTPTALQATSVGGRNYLFPFITVSGRVGCLYRKDWAEKLNIAPPKTVQDFYNMAKAFTEQDPDGNSKNDTFGFAYIDDADKEVQYAGFETIAVGLGAPNRWGVRDGKVVPYFETPEYMDTLKLFKDMYDKKYMNQDFYLIKGNNKYNPILTSQAGIMFTTATNSVYPGGKYDALTKENADARLTYALLFTTPAGKQVTNSVVNFGGLGGFVIPKKSVADEAVVKRIMRFCEEAMSGDNAKIYHLGIQDLHYTVGADGKITQSDEQKKLRESDGSLQVFASTLPRPLMPPDYGQAFSEKDTITAACIDNEPFVVRDVSIGLLSTDNITAAAGIATIISDARVKFIMGQLDEAGFKAEVEKWKAQGGQKIIDEINANYKP